MTSQRFYSLPIIAPTFAYHCSYNLPESQLKSPLNLPQSTDENIGRVLPPPPSSGIRTS
jgi:hypothetical protein